MGPSKVKVPPYCTRTVSSSEKKRSVDPHGGGRTLTGQEPHVGVLEGESGFGGATPFPCLHFLRLGSLRVLGEDSETESE